MPGAFCGAWGGVDSNVTPGWPVASSRDSAPPDPLWSADPVGPQRSATFPLSRRCGAACPRDGYFCPGASSSSCHPLSHPWCLLTLRSEPGLPACCSHTPQPGSQRPGSAQTHPPHAGTFNSPSPPARGLTVNAHHCWGAALPVGVRERAAGGTGKDISPAAW